MYIEVAYMEQAAAIQIKQNIIVCIASSILPPFSSFLGLIYCLLLADIFKSKTKIGIKVETLTEKMRTLQMEDINKTLHRRIT